MMVVVWLELINTARKLSVCVHTDRLERGRYDRADARLVCVGRATEACVVSAYIRFMFPIPTLFYVFDK